MNPNFQTRRWVDSICSDWDFNKVIPGHFDAPIPAKPADLKRAFSFAYEPTEEEESSEGQPEKGIKGLLAALFKKKDQKVRVK